MMIDSPIRIDPDAWYSDGQARLLLDLPGATLANARRRGQLTYRRVGNRILYSGRWIIEWLMATEVEGDHGD